MKFLLVILSFFITRVDIIAQNFNLEQLSNLRYEREMSDIWGWSDGIKEYALVATTHYFSIVDVTDPENPVKLHQIDGPNGGPGSYWREIKTYGNYAYGVHDGTNLGGSSHGLVIVDLSGLPGNISTTFWETDGTLQSPFKRAHNIFIDEFGYAYLVGHNIGARGALILDLNDDPLNPKVVGEYTGNYIHDCFVRDNIMWASEGNDGFAVIDVSDKSNPVQLARQSTFGYSHNIWLSDDSKTAFTTDENGGRPIAAFDVSDLNDITLLDQFRSGSNVIPHNVFVKDDFAIASYYREGVVMVDISEPDELVKVGQYDTSPLSGNGFNGCWGVYPYLPSGNIIASDIEGGLYVFAPTYEKAVHIRGNVIDEATGNEIFEANIEIKNSSSSLSIQSDIEGAFKKGLSNSGTYNIIVSKPGYNSYTTNITLNSGDVFEEEIALSTGSTTINDTIYQEILVNDTLEICYENTQGVNADKVYGCDDQTSSIYGSWTIDEQGCLTYNSNNINGQYVDSICFVIENSAGTTNTNVIIISISGAIVTSNISNAFDTGGLQLVENPVQKTLLLKNEINIRAPLQLDIYNMSGQLITSKSENGLSNLISLPVEQLNKGIYVLQVRSENKNFGIAKFIKE